MIYRLADDGALMIEDDKYCSVATDDDMGFINKACDSHEDLLAACKMMYAAWEQLLPCLKDSVVQDYELVLTKAPTACTKAIAKAEGKI